MRSETGWLFLADLPEFSGQIQRSLDYVFLCHTTRLLWLRDYNGDVTLNPPTRSSLRAMTAKVETWLHDHRAQRAKQRGKVPTIIPYIGYGSTSWVRVLGRVLYLKPQELAEGNGRSDLIQISKVRGWRTFTSVAVPEQPVNVFVDGQMVATAQSNEGGVIDTMIDVPLSPGWHTLGLSTEESDVSETPVFVVGDDVTQGVISDVDDTILQTALPKPLVAAWNTFVVHEQARAATPGMPILLQQLVERDEGSPIMYVSTGAWNAAPALSRFLARNLYPVGALLLTDWGPTHDRFFRSGKEHKRQELRRIALEFPHIKWVLIGDDGQKDEMLYHEFSTEHPNQVAAVAIRQLSTGEAVLKGGRSKARLHRSVSGVPWVYGPNGATLKEELVKLGVL